jgi:hypothetical protein
MDRDVRFFGWDHLGSVEASLVGALSSSEMKCEVCLDFIFSLG